MSAVRVDQALSAATAVGANTFIFVMMFVAGLNLGPPMVEELPHVMAEMVQLPRLGDTPPSPKALPRIVKAPEPLPVETDAVSLSREKEDEFEKEEKERKRKLAEKKRRLEEERKKRDDERRKREEERKKRKKMMAEAMRKIDDPRADNEDAPGFDQGSAIGTSTDPNTLRNKQVYLTTVSHMLGRFFDVPAVIPPDVRHKLSCEVFFRLDAKGKVKGAPRLVRSSGNKFFDEAALRTVRKFGPGSQLRLPVPKEKKLRKAILREGLAPRMKGK